MGIDILHSVVASAAGCIVWYVTVSSSMYRQQK